MIISAQPEKCAYRLLAGTDTVLTLLPSAAGFFEFISGFGGGERDAVDDLDLQLGESLNQCGAHVPMARIIPQIHHLIRIIPQIEQLVLRFAAVERQPPAVVDDGVRPWILAKGMLRALGFVLDKRSLAP